MTEPNRWHRKWSWDMKCEVCGKKEATINLQDVVVKYEQGTQTEMFHIGNVDEFYCRECYLAVKNNGYWSFLFSK